MPPLPGHFLVFKEIDFFPIGQRVSKETSLLGGSVFMNICVSVHTDCPQPTCLNS